MSAKEAQDKIVNADFRALAKAGAEEVRNIISINLGDMPMSALDLPRIKMPSGDTLMWTVPSVTGDPTIEKEIEAVIVAKREARIYWEAAFGEGERKPPDCSSPDGKHGQGDPGGMCGICPWNEWGSDPNPESNAKACKECLQLFLLRGDSILPYLLALTPGSLGGARQFFLGISGQARTYFSVVTGISLIQEKTSGGIPYPRAVLRMIGDLSEDQRYQAEQFVALMDQITPQVSADDYLPADNTVSKDTEEASSKGAEE